MSLLAKLGLPARPQGTEAPGARPRPVRAKVAVPAPDASDGRRTRLDLDAAGETGAEPAPDAEAKRMRVDIVNRTGFALSRVAFFTEDPEQTAYDAKPPDTIADKGVASVIARSVGNAPTTLAGSVDYAIGINDLAILATMSWQLKGNPSGKVNFNDGRFVVRSVRKGDDRFQYVVETAQSPAPEPGPPMKIRLDNFSGTTLFRESFGLDNAKAQFNPEPPKILDGGKGKAEFTVFSLDPEFPQLSGFADYSFTVEPPRMDENPSGKYRMSIAWAEEGVQIGNITPEGKNMEIEFGGDERNPIFSFFGASPEFKPPGKASEPTLRKGDKSPDGWVEYLQELLNLKGAKLEVDGDFGGETLKAVKAFQRKHKKEGVLEDGVVGEETWSFLREGAPAKPKTDGRKPHTFVEKGNSARWALESRMPVYDEADDVAVMQAVSVGDVDQIAKRIVRFRIVSPSDEEKFLDRPIGGPFESSKTGQGNRHNIAIKDFSELFGKPPVPRKPVPGVYKITAYFPADLGGDTYEGTLKIDPP